MDDKEKVEKALALVSAFHFQPLDNDIGELYELLLSGRVLGRTIDNDSEKCELAKEMVTQMGVYGTDFGGGCNTEEESTAEAQLDEIRNIFR